MDTETIITVHRSHLNNLYKAALEKNGSGVTVWIEYCMLDIVKLEQYTAEQVKAARLADLERIEKSNCHGNQVGSGFGQSEMVEIEIAAIRKEIEG